ncbi:hypothetical protein QFC22_002939 [Naganishia vaughanmartiniae]|uniref:Uncharacterized protein n=1 Tax=Naganishia vaughanmartiniae TaxID=1424756 RepID=A0ACC2X9S2_9TREE|nr:hypothetical protein QFC22_002939 [Naganishia vaughanmartiniae]
MSFNSSVTITIRPATDKEYVELGRLHAKVFLPDPLWQLLVRKINPKVWLEWYFNEQGKEDVKSGFASVIVARRKDTNELVGGAWNKIFTPEHPPTRPPCQFPDGWNVEEDKQMDVPRFKYQQELFNGYGKLFYVHEFVVADEYQGKGIGKQIMKYIIEEAKQAGMNIALTAAPGKPGFYKKLGFQPRGKPIIGTDGQLEGITLMDLELFKPAQSLSSGGPKTISHSIIIRQAREDEYMEVARLYYAAMSTDRLTQLLTSKVDKTVRLKWMAEQLEDAVDGGFSSLLVAQRTDNGQLVGATLLIRKTKENRPIFPSCRFPEGYNEKELMQISLSGVPFQERFLAQYGDFIYVAEFVVAPNYQGKDIGRRLLEAVIAEGKSSRMNLALTAASGKAGFYEKLGFEVAGKPPMSTDGTVEGLREIIGSTPGSGTDHLPLCKLLHDVITSTRPSMITIRPIKASEYLEVARLYCAAISPSRTIQLLVSKVDPSEWLQYTAKRFKLAADEGASVLVAQRTDTGELAGVALTESYSKENRPTMPNCQFPAGYNQKEAERIIVPEAQFQKACLAKYGGFIYIDEFAVGPAYQGQGIGRHIAEHIIAKAKESGKIIALSAASGTSLELQKDMTVSLIAV